MRMPPHPPENRGSAAAFLRLALYFSAALYKPRTL